MSDIYDIVQATRIYWELPPRPMFHHIISLIIAQEISFALGKKIRSNLYKHSEAVGHRGYITPNYILSNTDYLSKQGLRKRRVDTIIEIAEIAKDNPYLSEIELLERISTISGVGEWTISGAQVLMQFAIDDIPYNITLHTDKWIRKRVSQLADSDSILSSRKTKEVFDERWPDHQTLMSMFLWRIKISGIDRLKRGKELRREDFL
jgi:3-methyladenine DNA glycosylase/8-oxoguanine DNA glycosylase